MLCLQAAVATHVPRLTHLHARYCKRITDLAVQAITHHLENLHSLDLSFCTQVSHTAILSLLQLRGDSLSELRLQGCRNIAIGNTVDYRGHIPTADYGVAGCTIVDVLRSHGVSCCLASLDVRGCGGQPRKGAEYEANDPFVMKMAEMGFRQRVPGYFDRPARWNTRSKRRLVDELARETPLS